MDWGGDNEWNFTFSLDDDDDTCIAVEIAGEDMSADKDDVPKIQWLNSVLAHIVSEIYNEEFWEE